MKTIPGIHSDHVSLTHAQVEVARLVAFGKCNKQIANLLDIKVDTVAKHIQGAFEKLHVSNRVGVAEFMIEFNYVTWEEIHAAQGVKWRI